MTRNHFAFDRCDILYVDYCIVAFRCHRCLVSDTSVAREQLIVASLVVIAVIWRSDIVARDVLQTSHRCLVGDTSVVREQLFVMSRVVIAVISRSDIVAK